MTAEAQMMNTIEYRVDCQMLRYLHHDNDLGCRFPIGQTDQVSLQGLCEDDCFTALRVPIQVVYGVPQSSLYVCVHSL